jgi:hypothetical protein
MTVTKLRWRLAGLLRALARRVEPPGHVSIVPGMITGGRIVAGTITGARMTDSTIGEPGGRRES